MKLRNSILFAVLLTIGTLNAQTDFRAGYIIETTGDTLYGEIDYRGDLWMGSLCKFRDYEDVITNYSPEDITAYRFIDSKYFISREVSGKLVFLEYLIKGEVNIYYLRDEKGDKYFIDKEGVGFRELTYQEGIKHVNNEQFFFKSKQHNNMLKYYMSDAPELEARILTMNKPDHRNLIKLTKDYQEIICDEEECLIYEKKLPLLKVSLEPVIGIKNYYKSEFSVREIGAYFYLWSPRSNDRIYMKTGYLLVKEADFSISRIPIQFQYNYRAHKLQPNISAGFNVLTLNNYVSKELKLSLSLNAGLNYKLSNSLYISTGVDLEQFNMKIWEFDHYVTEKEPSYTFYAGLRIDL